MIDSAPEMELLLAACVGDAEAGSVVDLRNPAATHCPDGSARDLWERAVGHLVHVGGSDLHLKAGSRPRVRVNGHLHPAPLPVLTSRDCEAILAHTMTVGQAEQYDRTNEADYAVVAGVGRFRVNAFRERGHCAIAVRAVATVVPSAQALGLLPAVQRLATQTNGLCLIAGRVGSGKSTTLAWIIDRINDTRDANIIMIEDPIEYVHADKRSIVHQREVGTDTGSYAEALRRALRQDPDVIVIGEIRDADTARTALSAAQTGHLVLATLHTDTTGETIDRLIDLFPAHDRPQARLGLASTLRAVVCQRLVSCAADNRRLLAQEVLLASGHIAQRIIDPTAAGLSIADLVANDAHLGMVSFDQHLLALHEAGRLSRRDALTAATHPHNLSLQIGSTQG